MNAPLSHPLTELWRPVLGFEGVYEVSSLGRVRSLDRHVSVRTRWGGTAQHQRVGRVLRSHLNAPAGYLTVELSVNARGRRSYVHRLVCEAFHGPAPEGHEVAHLNGDRLDCRADNLMWATTRENAHHRALHGTRLVGEATPLAKLTEAKVRQIRSELASGQKIRSVAALFGVSKTTIERIAKGSTWSHVR